MLLSAKAVVIVLAAFSNPMPTTAEPAPACPKGSLVANLDLNPQYNWVTRVVDGKTNGALSIYEGHDETAPEEIALILARREGVADCFVGIVKMPKWQYTQLIPDLETIIEGLGPVNEPAPTTPCPM